MRTTRDVYCPECDDIVDGRCHSHADFRNYLYAILLLIGVIVLAVILW